METFQTIYAEKISTITFTVIIKQFYSYLSVNVSTCFLASNDTNKFSSSNVKFPMS